MFVAIYSFFEGRRPLARLLFFITLALFAFLGSRLRFTEDVSSMLPQSEALQTMNGVIARTGAGEKLIFLLSFRDTTFTDQDSLIAVAERYRAGLRNTWSGWSDETEGSSGEGVEEALSTVFIEHLPLLLTEEDYRALDTLTQPDRIRETMAENKRVLLSPAGTVYKQMVAADPLGLMRRLWARLGSLQLDSSYEVYNGHLFAEGGRKLTFLLRPGFSAAQTGVASEALKRLDRYNDSFSKALPHVRITYFGGPAVAAGNAAQMRQDTVVTLSVTLVLLLALSYYYFRRKRTPLLLLLPVLYGAAGGLAIVYLLQGSISLIALGAGAVVLGIAMDYSIHFLSQARHSSLREAVRELQVPLTIGSATTIAAFLALRLVQLPLLRDLGLFAAGSLLCAALCTLIFLPHFLPRSQHGPPVRSTFFDSLAHFEPAKSKVLLWSILLLTPFMVWASMRVQFDDDPMNLNYLSPRLQEAQDEVAKASPDALSSVFVVAKGETEDSALANLEQVSPIIDSLHAAGSLRALSNPTIFLPSSTVQQRRAEEWQRYWSERKKSEVMEAVRAAALAEGFAPAAFDGLEDRLGVSPQFIDSPSLQVLKGLFPAGFSEGAEGQHYALANLKVVPEHRDAVLAKLKGSDGIIATDKREGAQQLVRLLRDDFGSIALYSSCIVFFALLIAYGRIELALISFLPMAISWVWILGVMALFGIKFNIVNIIISTLIFGLGDDYSIFTLNGLIERYRYKRDSTGNVRAAVYVSVATILIGLGALLLAKHPALRSIAAISITGMLCVLLISQTLQPALFNALIQRRADKGFLPFTAWSLAKSTFAFLYFLGASLIVTLLGFILTTLRPFGKERSKAMLHRLIRAGNGSLLAVMANVRKRRFNEKLADFSRPAVYIANHSSFLDILLLTSMHHKLVLLTNRWVYRSPVFGAAVRMAEYYPVADGAEESIAPLRDLVARGYSIVVFPEGTRSTTDKIARFHKGAFYIAEHLQLDVVPLIIHGAHYTMQKGDWLLKDGSLNLYFNKRIAPADPAFGATYSERAKGFGRWYRQKLADIKAEQETPLYFREQLLRCYTYKGPVLEWYCRIKTALEGNYEVFHRLLPREGRIYDLGCGYGFAAHALHWAAPGREIKGYDYDADKVATAEAVHLKGAGVSFSAADLRELQLEPADGILLMDVLHYLLPEEQAALLRKCAAALRPGGVLIVRDGVKELTQRQKGTALTELFSTRLLRFNKTTNELHFISEETIKAFARQEDLALEVLDDAKLTSNLTFVLRRG